MAAFSTEVTNAVFSGSYGIPNDEWKSAIYYILRYVGKGRTSVTGTLTELQSCYKSFTKSRLRLGGKYETIAIWSLEGDNS